MNDYAVVVEEIECTLFFFFLIFNLFYFIFFFLRSLWICIEFSPREFGHDVLKHVDGGLKQVHV